MSDAKWKIIFTFQILFIVLIGGVVSLKMGLFEDIKHDLIFDANAETINMEQSLKSSESKIAEVSKEPANKIVKEDIKKEVFQKASIEQDEEDIKKEPLRVFQKASDEEVQLLKEKYSDQIKEIFKTITTSYNSEAGQTDDSPCIAAKGMDLCKRGVEDILATNDFPIHTKIMIPEYFGDRIFYVEDRMNERYTGTKRIDIWLKKKSDSKSWGAKTVTIFVIKE